MLLIAACPDGARPGLPHKGERPVRPTAPPNDPDVSLAAVRVPANEWRRRSARIALHHQATSRVGRQRVAKQSISRESVRGVVTQAQHTAGQSLQEEESSATRTCAGRSKDAGATRVPLKKARGSAWAAHAAFRIQRLLTPPRDFRWGTTGIRYAGPLRTQQINALALIPT
jgi:hypothetical protein